MQGRGAILISGSYVGAVFNQHLHHLAAVASNRFMQRCLAIIIRGADICSRAYQQLRHFRVGSHVQRRPAILTSRIDVGAFSEKLLHYRGVFLPYRQVERGGAAAGLCVYIDSRCEKLLYLVLLATRGRIRCGISS